MLTGTWVDPEFRKKGVGRQLVDHALQVARDFSVIDSNQQNREGNDRQGRILVLEVHATNFEAQISDREYYCAFGHTFHY